jgi:hypothetical protein
MYTGNPVQQNNPADGRADFQEFAACDASIA